MIDEVRFSRLGDLLSYYHDHKETDKILILESLNMQELKFNGEPVTPTLYVEFMQQIAQMYIDFYTIQDLQTFVLYLTDTNTELFHRYMYHYPAETYNTINALLEYKVGYITVDEPLVFDIDNLKRYINGHDEECKLRVRPDRGQYSWMPANEFSGLCHFWILPQHIHLYEEYIDVIDLLAVEDRRESRLISVYGEDGYWDSDMNALIYNLHLPNNIKGVFLDEELAQKRLNCRQICQSTYPQRCHRCELEVKIYDQLSRGKRPIPEDNTTQSQS